MSRSSAAVVACATVLSSCVSNGLAPSSSQKPIPLEAILAQMKCELAMALTKLDRDKLAFDGWYIDGKLFAKVVTSDKVTGSIGTPELLPLNSRLNAEFKVGGDVTTSRTLDLVMDFVVSPYATDTAICNASRAPNVRRVEGLGIYQWLYSITQTPSGAPRIGVTHLSYTLDFGVLRTGKSGLDVSIISIKASASANTSRDDTNKLVLTFSPGDAAVAKAKVTASGGGDVVTRPRPSPGGGGTVQLFNLPYVINDDTAREAEKRRELPEPR